MMGGDLVPEIAAHPTLDLRCPVTAADEPDLVIGQLRQQHFIEYRILATDLLVHQLGDPRQSLVWLQAVGTRLFAGERDLLLQTGDTNLEELIEVAGKDKQELEPLEQRVGLVQRLLQHTDIELQLRQLTVDIKAAVVQVRHHRSRQGRRQLVDDFALDGCGHGIERLGFVRGLLKVALAQSLVRHHSASSGLPALAQNGLSARDSTVVPPAWRSR